MTPSHLIAGAITDALGGLYAVTARLSLLRENRPPVNVAHGELLLLPPISIFLFPPLALIPPDCTSLIPSCFLAATHYSAGLQSAMHRE